MKKLINYLKVAYWLYGSVVREHTNHGRVFSFLSSQTKPFSKFPISMPWFEPSQAKSLLNPMSWFVSPQNKKRYKFLSLFFFLISCSIYLKAQQSNAVSKTEMEQIYQEIKTPFKYGLVMVPNDIDHKMDCPTIFRKGKFWYMTYLIYSGRGYETWLAKSKDLLNWENQGKLMSFGDAGNWDDNQKAGYNALQNIEWGGSYKLGKFDGKYWMSYFGGKEKGYETEPLSIGMAYALKDPSTVQEWTRLPKPVLTSADADVRWWENRNKLFKSTVIEDKQRFTGHPFVMYYNAVGDSLANNKKTRWYERIGMAVSDDMVHWQRFQRDPVVHHPVGITGDGVIQKIGRNYVMFYFGAFWQDRKGAFNRFAVSKDLINWTDWTGDNLIESSEKYDALYAHKSFVLKYKGVVYHFYCAVNKQDQRGIAVATSKDVGKSKMEFVK
ncbi:glycoside hydrolase family protein [Pedobacter paludis]|uniref:glycosylase n=1 Tax=Pedobacter paludis TaxID=2203212 RepID=UPI001F0BCCB3|nr:glycosylase [Pedobacter paludis]